MKTFPAVAANVHLQSEHRRLMIMKGQLHLEKIATSAAGMPSEPLPKFKKSRPRI